MPLLPIVTSQGVMPCLLTPPYAFALLIPGLAVHSRKAFTPCSMAPLLENRECLLSFTTTMCHDFRTHRIAKHIRVRMCLIASKICFLGIMWRPSYHLCTGGPSKHSPAFLAYGASFGQVGGTRRRALHPRFQTMRTQHGSRASIPPPKSLQ